MSAFLAVRSDDYVREVSPLPFIGLPREELERLRGVIEVFSTEHVEPKQLCLTAYAAVHYNYAWLSKGRSLGAHVPLVAAGAAPGFLDHKLDMVAKQALQATTIQAPADWRCAGLLNHAGQLALVYIVRLHQRPAQRTQGNTELQLSRADFDAPSQLLIDNLHAF
jgi:hypothetical protein